MKSITVEIDDERYEDFKLFKNAYEAGGMRVARSDSSHSSSKRRIAWHEITIGQLHAERPDLVRAICDARGSWAAAVSEMVKAIEAGKPAVRLISDAEKQRISKSSGCLVLLALIAGAATTLAGAIILALPSLWK